MTTPYRNEIDALQERKTALQAEISKLREQTTQLDELRTREVALASELAGVEGRLAAGAAPKRMLPLLDQVRVASPCKAEWNEMLGDERVRFCLSCEKNVYNLSSMQHEDAEALLQERLGSDLCVRFYQRADGTILTQDCPEGVKKKRRKKLMLAVAGAGAMAAAATTMLMRSSPCRTTAVAGGVMYQGEPSAVQVEPVTPVAPDLGPGQWAAGGLSAVPQQPVTPVKKPTAKPKPAPAPVVDPAEPTMGRR